MILELASLWDERDPDQHEFWKRAAWHVGGDLFYIRVVRSKPDYAFLIGGDTIYAREEEPAARTWLDQRDPLCEDAVEHALSGNPRIC